MRVLVIEDEVQAAQRLKTLLTELLPGVIFPATIDTVKKAVQWLENNPTPDLIMMDIQLADGISFQIFEAYKVDCPVIFTTAYDEYALKAFKVNSVDYILKPVDKDELARAIEKFRKIAGSTVDTDTTLQNISEAVRMLMKKYKSRFVIKVGEHLKTVEVSSIRFFFSQDKATFCVTDDGRHHIIDYTLEQLEELVDPSDFFRVNRKYLIRASAINDIISYTNSRLRLVLKGSEDSDIIVARERVQEFKEWLDR